MKKWIMALVCLMTMVMFSSCGTKYVVTANYDVCYPDGTRTYNETTKIVSNSKTERDIYVKCYSNGGTNYISCEGKYFISTTAPIRLNDYNVEKAKKKRSTTYNKSKKDDLYMSDILSY